MKGGRGPLDIRTVRLTAAIAAGAALLIAIVLIVPRKGVFPFWGRALDMAEGFVLLSLVPLCPAVLGVYTRARGVDERMSPYIRRSGDRPISSRG